MKERGILAVRLLALSCVSRLTRILFSAALAVWIGLPGPAGAQVAKEPTDSLDHLTFIDNRLMAQPAMEPMDDAESLVVRGVRNSWHEFRANHGEWNAQIDKRTGRIDFAEGAGVAWVPGHGNSLGQEDIAVHLTGREKVDLPALESISRSFLPRVAHLLGVDVKSLKLDLDRSGSPADHLWFVDYNVEISGMAVEGARVVFRVNNGNLIQFGSENLPAPGARAPKVKISRKQALAVLADYVGGMRAGDVFVDGGSLRMLPVAVEDSRFNDGFELGRGRGLAVTWQFTFRREGEGATWRARIDATDGEILEFRDINAYAQATGAVKFLGVPQTRPMPFANLSSGGYTDSAGVYTYGGGSVTSTLNGQYVRIADTCGSISQSSNASGDILFGGTTGTDCTTPGSGGAGNTHAARTQFYHVNRAKEIARGWITRPWLTSQLTANVNINDTCNGYWNGSTINFYRSGGGCANSGEIEGFSLHEYGHGLDSNDGSSSSDAGTGEAYGDFTAVLATRTSCVASGFRLVSNCPGYGDACTSCTGLRDVDWAKRTSNTPHTVANYTQVRCPASSYSGPCGRQGHCEAHIPTEALWDLVNRDLPNPGSAAAWNTVERLWYLSRSTATAAFTCIASGTWTSHGCNAGSLWKTMRAVDDDDGNLANGTPNSAALYAAFNRHGIACTTDTGASTSFRGCTPPAVPTISLTGGNNQVTVNWSGSSGVYDVYRSEHGCYSGFTKVANDTASSPFVDTGLTNSLAYYYQVTAQPNGNEACASAPAVCQWVALSGAPSPTPYFFENYLGWGDLGQCGYNSATFLYGAQGVPAGTWTTPVRIDTDNRSGGCTQEFRLHDPIGRLSGLRLKVNFQGPSGQCKNTGLREIVPNDSWSSIYSIDTDDESGYCTQTLSLEGRSDVALDVHFEAESNNGQCGGVGTFPVVLGRSATFTLDTDERSGGCRQKFRLRLNSNADGDGVGDAADGCPYTWSSNPSGCGSVCGNNTCESGESPWCCQDCGAYCGNYQCESACGESEWTCPTDCSLLETCGDSFCDVWQGECASNCPQDCTNGELCQ